MLVEVGEAALEALMGGHVPRDQPRGSRAGPVIAVGLGSRRAEPARARPGPGSCWNRAAAPPSRRSAPAVPGRPRPCASAGRGRHREAPEAAQRPSAASAAPFAGSPIPPSRHPGYAACRRPVSGRRGASPSSSRPGAGSTGPRSWPPAWLSINSSTGVRGGSPSSQPSRLSGRGLEPLSAWRATFSPMLLEHRSVVGGLGAERGQEVAHHHAVEPGPDGQRLQVARGSRPGRRRAGRARRG